MVVASFSRTASAANGPVVVGQVHEQQGRVGRPDHARHPAFHHVGGDRRQVDELDAHVFPVHHAGGRLVRGERIGGDFRRGPGQSRQQPALAGVRRADQRDLAGPLPRNLVGDAAAFLVPIVLDLLGGVLDLGLQLGLQLFAGLVLGHQREHLPQAGQPFLGGLGLLVLGLGFQVLRRQIGGHRRSAPARERCVNFNYSPNCADFSQVAAR